MESSDEEDVDLEGEVEADVQLNDPSYKLHLIFVWKEPNTMTKRLTVAVLLPSGVEAGILLFG